MTVNTQKDAFLDAEESFSLSSQGSVSSAVEGESSSTQGEEHGSVRTDESGAAEKTGLRNRKYRGTTKPDEALVSDEEASESSCSEKVDEIEECSEIVSEDGIAAEPLVPDEPIDVQTYSEIEAAECTAEEERPLRREVYRMPDDKTGSSQDSLVFWPANFVIFAISWQVRLIFYFCSAVISSLVFLCELVANPVQKTADVKKQVSEHMKPMMTDMGPRVGSFAKRVGWGIAAVTYVGLVLSFLVVPVVLVEYFYVTKFIEEPLDIKAPLFFNYTEARPSAMVSLAPYVDSAQRAGGGFSWNRLHATVTLTLPESDYNRQLGMFQVAAELLSVRNDILQRSSRPCMLRFQSLPIRYAKTLLYSVPVLLDVTGEYQLLHLDVVEIRQQTSGATIGGVKVYLEPRAGFPPGAGLPELYASELRVRSELPWCKSVVHRWKRTIYVWTATLLFLGEVSIVLCCFRQVLLPKRRKQLRETHSTSSKHQEAPPVTRKVRGGRGSKKRVSFQETAPEVWI